MVIETNLAAFQVVFKMDVYRAAGELLGDLGQCQIVRSGQANRIALD